MEIEYEDIEEKVKVKRCDRCKGTGYLMCWNRTLQKHELDNSYKCEYCHGARYIVEPEVPTEYK